MPDFSSGIRRFLVTTAISVNAVFEVGGVILLDRRCLPQVRRPFTVALLRHRVAARAKHLREAPVSKTGARDAAQSTCPLYP
jgi:hypothetical protein